MVNSNHKMILSSGRFSGTTRADLTQAFDAFVSSEQKNTLVIHFHGGLVSEADAETIAEALMGNYQTAGGYPFFIIWQSWVSETLRNNWREIIGLDAFEILVNRSVQFLIGLLNRGPGARGVPVNVPSVIEVEDEVAEKQAINAEPFAHRNAETSLLEEELSPEQKKQFETLLAKDNEIGRAADQLREADTTELNPELQADLEKDRLSGESGTRGLGSPAALIAAGLRIVGRALKRFSSGRDHGLYTTVIEETFRELKGAAAGGLLWRHMKKDTADSFNDPDDQFGGTALLKEIARAWEDGHRPRIVLVGHSAGSVYICNLLHKAAAILPPEIRFEVIFLAPACTFKLLDSTLNAAGDRIRSFRSYGMKDEIERKDAIFKPFYLYSLLYLVSGVLEDEVDDPLVGMERFSAAVSSFNSASSPEVARVLQRLAAFPSPWVWSGSNAGPGLLSQAQKHGDFDNEPKTLASIEHLIKHGVV